MQEAEATEPSAVSEAKGEAPTTSNAFTGNEELDTVVRLPASAPPAATVFWKTRGRALGLGSLYELRTARKQ